MRCAVCGQSGRSREWTTVSGITYGASCDGECQGLLWEAFVVRHVASASPAYAEWEAAMVRWKWQRRRAELAGRTFNAIAPASPAERACRAAVSGAGLDFIAREVA